MKLEQLIKELDVEKIIGETDIEISDVKTDSNNVGCGDLFVALEGVNTDGHDYAHQAQTYGGVAVVCQRELNTSLTQIIVKNARKALSKIAAAFYQRKCDRLKLIGVVGTNGKTTTSRMIYEILNDCGINCGVIGTLGTFYNQKYISTDLTTPDPLTLHKILSLMYDDGVKVVVMEVSAHAIFWDKVYGLNFEIGVFTNFSRDHIDFFSDMENYKNSKLRFFKENSCKFVVTNSDDPVGKDIESLNGKVVSYGLENPADVFAVNVEELSKTTEFVINLFDCIYQIKTNFLGRFNVSNALAAATTCALIGAQPEKIAKALKKIKGVAGRLERVYADKFSVILDYAHTPDGLEKTILALRPTCKGRLVTVFGCGGNRDKGKRAQMGEISAKLSDFTIVTTDNPRFEEPMEIIRDIEKGVLKHSKRYLLIEDRRSAIEYAINWAKQGDVVLIAGKGSENYQEILGVKHAYNDKDTVNELIRGK